MAIAAMFRNDGIKGSKPINAPIKQSVARALALRDVDSWFDASELCACSEFGLCSELCSKFELGSGLVSWFGVLEFRLGFGVSDMMRPFV